MTALAAVFYALVVAIGAGIEPIPAARVRP